MRTRNALLCSSLIGLGFSTPAISPAHAGAGDPVGQASLIENFVTADYARDTRSLQVGDGVRQEEIIEAGLDSRGEFRLDDDTKLAVGPGSSVTLDKFVYDPETATGSIMLNITKGAMRWVTGVARKPTYVIRTPNASITVRGTIFDLYVNDKEETWLLLHEGSVQVCNANGQCKVHSEACKLTRVSDTGTVSGATSWSKLPGAKDNMFHRAFPFVAIPPQMATEPTCTRDMVINQRDASAPPPEPTIQKAEGGPDYVPRPKIVRSEPAYKPSYAQAKPEPRVVERPKPVREANYEPVREKQPKYEKPKRTAKVEKMEYAKPKREKEVEYSKPKRVVKYERYVPKRERYVERDDDDRDDDRKERYPRRGGGSGVGKVLLGAAIVGGAIALGKWGGGHGGYGY